MSFEYISLQEALNNTGLRMVVVGDIPSPWGEAAKAIFHLKKLNWSAVRLDYKDKAFKQWTGDFTGPIVLNGSEPPIDNWLDILTLAERFSPNPTLIPLLPEEKEITFELANQICGKDGLGWTRRLQLIHAGMENEGGFSSGVANYLGHKYGYSKEAGEAANQIAAFLLNNLARHLHTQEKLGSRYYSGQSISVIDVYSATCMALFEPLAQGQCKMDERTRTAFKHRTPEIESAFDPILIAHRDYIYQNHLELPLSL